MLKHPPQQTTRRYASDSRRTGAFNFAQFVSLLSASGFHYDRLHSRPATRSSFSYQLRLTRTKVGTFCLMEISPSCVGGYFPRKRNTAQDVCLLFVLEGELMVTSHAESTRLAKGEVLIGDPHNLISFVAKKKVTLFLCARLAGVLLYACRFPHRDVLWSDCFRRECGSKLLY